MGTRTQRQERGQGTAPRVEVTLSCHEHGASLFPMYVTSDCPQPLGSCLVELPLVELLPMSVGARAAMVMAQGTSLYSSSHSHAWLSNSASLCFLQSKVQEMVDVGASKG